MADDLNFTAPPAAAPLAAAGALPLTELLARLDHGVALTDAEGRLRWCNAVMSDCYLGFPEDDAARGAAGRHISELFRPLFHEAAQWARVEAGLERLARSPKGRVEIGNLALGWAGRPMRRIDLALCELPGADPDGAPWVAWYFYDTTAWRRTEENLQALLRHSSDGIFMLDADCRLRVFNEACERITGRGAEEVLGREGACAEVFGCTGAACAGRMMEGGTGGSGKAGEDARAPGEEAPLCFLQGGAHQTRELAIRTSSGGQVWAEISFAPVMDEQGRLAYVLGILRDVSQRRQLEEQLRLTRKLATLGELTSAMAHEIKNPLGIILSAAEIVMNPARLEDERAQAAEFIRDEAKRLDERMRVFLSFSRPRPPEFTVQSVHRALMQTVIAYETLARQGLAIWTDFGPCLPRVRVDADQMQQVFLNLLMNADQAMPAGGRITLTTRLNEADGWVAVEVADEGTGLAEAAQGKIFEPFYSTKPRGTGLGLAIVMHIVAAHGGRVEAKNRETCGAAFTVYLPPAG